MHHNILKIVFILLFLAFDHFILRGQDASVLFSDDTPAFGDGGMATEDDGGPPNQGLVPVDGGLSLLLAAGAAYGARRLRRRKFGESRSIFMTGH